MYQKILVPLDGSKLAECALPHVKNLVKVGVVGEVTLLNVVTVHIPGHGELYPGPIDINAIRENLFMGSRKYLADVESRLASEGIKVRMELLEGNRPADTISDYAQKNGVDMIVIATHGYTGLKKLMLGSVALQVLHDSHVPVLLIRPESRRR
ncbi:MAG: universal stress protein [Proteobacteria bacterium]|nr:universal stress protein [Pseudomonadota bacterium]